MRYVIFGAGEYYKRYRKWFTGRNVVAIIDNDASKQGTIMDGVRIVAPEKLAEYSYDAIVILSFYYSEMKQQLLSMGVDEGVIFHFYDLHRLFQTEQAEPVRRSYNVLLLSHDLSLGGPALALFHAAAALKKQGYEVVFGSMMDGELREKLEENSIPVIIDERLQVCTMNEVAWTNRYDLIICNTINYHVFLSERHTDVPVIWWLHESAFFYDAVRKEALEGIDKRNLRIVSVGPVPRNAMLQYMPDVMIDDLIYGVSNEL